MTTQSTHPVEVQMPAFFAPARLTADSRLEFRRAVLEQLEQAVQQGASTLEVDLGGSVEMDASGLGVLVLLQKRARERNVRIRLAHAPRQIYDTLRLTRLDALFEFSKLN